jgi:hypothetical protein
MEPSGTITVLWCVRPTLSGGPARQPGARVSLIQGTTVFAAALSPVPHLELPLTVTRIGSPGLITALAESR